MNDENSNAQPEETTENASPMPVQSKGPTEDVSAELAPSVDHAWKALGVITDWIKHAEAKAGATLAGSGLVGTALYNLVKDSDDLPFWLTWTIALSVALALAGALFAALALRPRLWIRDEPTSDLYFHHIARRHSRRSGGSTYVDSLLALTANSDRLIVEIASQVWANAHVARKKYMWGSLGLTCVLVSIAPLAVVAIGVYVESRSSGQ